MRSSRSGQVTPVVSIALLIVSAGVSADDTPLALADLEAYRMALAARPDASAPLVRFRDLWDRPEAYVGRQVRIEGRVARLFRQGRLGAFPPLVEAWVVSPAGDPFCLVFPQAEGRSSPEIGALVRFSGTFLKRIKYQGGDSPRVAPLLVGPDPLAVASNPSKAGESSWSSTDWMMGLGAVVVVAVVLAARHLARPEVLAPSYEPPPIFDDGQPGPGRIDGAQGELS